MSASNLRRMVLAAFVFLAALSVVPVRALAETPRGGGALCSVG